MDALALIERARACTRVEADRTHYVGSRAALLAAGLVPPGRFPGDPGNKLLRTTFVDAAGCYGTIKRRRCAGVETFLLELVHGTPEWRATNALFYLGRPADAL